MNFANFWHRPITLGIGELSASLDLPDGYYQLVIATSLSIAANTAWEVIGANVTGGTAELFRAQEGTAAREWPVGSVIFCSLTAATLDDIFAAVDATGELGLRVTALESASEGLKVAAVVGDTIDAFDGYTPSGPMLGYLPNGAVKISVLNDSTWSLVDLVPPTP
jgi:hypothetical protein